MNVVILEQAFEELKDAIAYYEEQQTGLGRKLKEEVSRHINWILNHPTVPRLRNESYRRVNLKVFPYYVPYIVRGKTLWILAIAHAHCKPEYWINRGRERS